MEQTTQLRLEQNLGFAKDTRCLQPRLAPAVPRRRRSLLTTFTVVFFYRRIQPHLEQMQEMPVSRAGGKREAISWLNER